MQYLIEKLVLVVNMNQEGQVVEALSISVWISWEVSIYYINGAFLILKRAAL